MSKGQLSRQLGQIKCKTEFIGKDQYWLKIKRTISKLTQRAYFLLAFVIILKLSYISNRKFFVAPLCVATKRKKHTYLEESDLLGHVWLIHSVVWPRAIQKIRRDCRGRSRCRLPYATIKGTHFQFTLRRMPLQARNLRNLVACRRCIRQLLTCHCIEARSLENFSGCLLAKALTVTHFT